MKRLQLPINKKIKYMTYMYSIAITYGAVSLLLHTYQFLVLLRKIRYVLNTDKGNEINADNELETLNFSLY